MNSTKRLDFEDFKQGFEIYFSRNDTGNNELKNEVLAKIDIIKNGMNQSRFYAESNLNNIRVTDYWLLGFIEGEGNFYIDKSSLESKFRLGQSSRDKALLEEIAKFLNTLVKPEGLELKDSSHLREVAQGNISIKSPFNLYNAPAKNPNAKPFSSLEISRSDFLLNIIVPYFKGLHWLSKKELDFIDWAIILKFKSEGKHLIPQGKELIIKIISQMNNSRLSTFSIDTSIDRVNLEKEIALFEDMPSNYKLLDDGKVVDIYSGNIFQTTKSKGVILVDGAGKVYKTFESGNSCAQYLGIGRTSVYSKIKSNKPVTHDNQNYYIKFI